MLHLHGAWEPSNIQLAQLAKQLVLPYVVSVHGMLDDWSIAQSALKKSLYLSIVGRRFFESAAVVHCTAQAELEQASNHWGRSRGVVIPCMMDLTPFDNLPGPGPAHAAFPDSRSERFKILFLSRLHVKKGLDVLIEATELLRRRGLAIRVLIAGTGEDAYVEHLRRLVRRLNLQDEVRFLGLVKGVEKISLYQAADVFVLPTSQENFGLVFPEAMACRVPVVTTTGVDIWRELQNAGAAIVDQTPSAVADAIQQIIAVPADRGLTGERGRAWVYETLSTARLLECYRQMYRAVSHQSRPEFR